jgi:hypothetical protein
MTVSVKFILNIKSMDIIEIIAVVIFNLFDFKKDDDVLENDSEELSE